jgi:hypothetical protein
VVSAPLWGQEAAQLGTAQARTMNLTAPSGVHPPDRDGPQSSQNTLNMTVTGPGWSLGNSGLWSVSQSEQMIANVFQRGIAHNMTLYMNKHATGDTAGFYSYTFSDGGVTAGSDEGITNANFEGGETNGYYHGTIAATSGPGDTMPSLTFQSGSKALTDGGILLDISKGTVACSLAGSSSEFASRYVQQLPTTCATLPLTTAYGTLTKEIPTQHTTADAPQSVTVTLTLGTIGGSTRAFTTGVAEMSGAFYPEQVLISAVQLPVAGQQTVTLKVRNPNPAGSVLFEGGLAGQYLSFDANLALSGYRSSYMALGSVDGTHLLYALLYGGGIINTLPQLGNEAATTTGPNAGFHLYPGAEIVRNDPEATHPTLEPNTVPWEAGDLVENPHPVQQAGHGLWVTTQRNSPCNASYGCEGLEVDSSGAGINGAFSLFYGRNYGKDSQYFDGGGPIAAPNFMTGYGEFGNDWYLFHGPQHGGAVIRIQNLANNIPASQWTTPIDVVNFNSVGGGHFTFTPSTSTWALNALRTSAITIGNAQPSITGNQGRGPNVLHCDAGTFKTGHVFTVAPDGSCQDGGVAPVPTLSASLVTTSAASDLVSLAGMTSSGHCTISPTNASAATGVGTFISAKTANAVTVSHPKMAGMSFDILCTPY